MGWSGVRGPVGRGTGQTEWRDSRKGGRRSANRAIMTGQARTKPLTARLLRTRSRKMTKTAKNLSAFAESPIGCFAGSVDSELPTLSKGSGDFI